MLEVMRRRREELQLSQAKLAALCNMASNCISDFELGKRQPWPRARKSISRALKMSELAEELMTNRSALWRSQREINNEFHFLYYGGREGTLAVLREEIKDGDPINLLALDVATLGMISNFRSDIDLLTLKQSWLETKGIDPRLIKKAIRTIELKHGH